MAHFSFNPQEAEVLLPPGTLHVKALHMGLRSGQVADVTFTPTPEFAWKPRRKGTRESNDNILWNIFANAPVTRKRARSPSPNQPSRKPAGRCAVM